MERGKIDVRDECEIVDGYKVRIGCYRNRANINDLTWIRTYEKVLFIEFTHL